LTRVGPTALTYIIPPRFQEETVDFAVTMGKSK